MKVITKKVRYAAIISIAWILIFGVCISGCKDNQNKSGELTGFTVSPTSISLVYGGAPDSQQITTEVSPKNATDVNFSWGVENDRVATVSQTGLVTASGVGSTRVVVVAGNYLQRIPVNVVDGRPPPDPCETDPHPGCPNYVDPEPVLENMITIGSANYTVDEKRVEKIEDGIWYMYAQLKNQTKPLVIHTVRFTAAYSDYIIETWIGNDSISGKESPGDMINRYEKAGREVKVAINGCFYDMAVGGTPLSAQVMRGVLTYPPLRDDFYMVGFNDKNQPYMDRIRLISKVKKESNNIERVITSVNTGQGANDLVLYNSYRGKRTGTTNLTGVEALIEPVEGQWEELDSHIDVRCRVMQVATQGNMEIPKGKIVLTGRGTDNVQFLNSLQPGELVSVTADYSLLSGAQTNSTVIRNVVSGSFVILRQNVIVHPAEIDNNPRTSVGFTNDKKYVFFTVVEGRNDASAGVSMRELAYVMQYFGATNAINLDGGGSSCMMIGKELKNNIVGGTWQRPVADGFAIIKK